MSQLRPPHFTAFALPFLALAILIAVRAVLGTPIPPEVLQPLLFGVTAAAAWLGGLGPGIVATALTVLAFAVFRRGEAGPIADSARLGLFAVVGALVSALGESLKRHRREMDRRSAEAARTGVRPGPADDALRLAADRYRVLASAPGQTVWLMPPDGSRAERLSGDDPIGLTEEQQRDSGWLEAVHPEDRARTVAAWRHALATGERYEIRHRLRARDGTYRHFFARAEPVLDSAGRVREWVGTSTDVTEQVEAERTLREQAELLSLAHDAIIVRDLDGTIRFWSTGAEEVYGISRADAVGKVTHDLLRSKLPAPVEEITTRLLYDGRWDGELTHTCADGREIVIDGRWVVRRDEGGRVAVLESNRDVTERRRAEDALRDSERRYRALYQSGPVGICERTLEGRFADANPRFCDITGYSRDELLGRSYEEITHPDDAREESELYRRLAAGELPSYPLEKRYRRKDGSVAWVRMATVVLADADGRPRRSVSVVQDVTARRRAEETLRSQREQYRVTLASINDAVAVTDGEAKVVFLNPAAEALTGWAQAEATGKPLEEVCRLVDGTTRWPADTPVRTALRGGSGVGLASHAVLLSRDGRETPVEDSASPVKDAAGRVAGAVLVFRDVTERRRAQEALQERERFIQRVLDTTPEVVTVYDLAEGRVAFVNAQVKRALGVSPADASALGAAFLERYWHPEDLARLPARAARFARALDGEVIESEYRLRHADGTWHWFAGREMVFTRNPDGTPRQILGVAGDVTARRRAEEALREGEERLRLAMEAGRLGSWEFDPAAGVLTGSDEALTYFGLPPGGRAGQADWDAAVHPDDRDRVRAARVRALRDGVNFDVEYRALRPDGGEHWVTARGRRAAGADGRPRLSGVCLDVTDRRRAEERLRFVSEFGATLAAATPDYDGALGCVARQVVPALADYCVVYIAGDDGELTQVAAAHADPAREQTLRDLGRTYRPSANARSRAAEVTRTGEPDLLTEVDPGLVDEMAPDEATRTRFRTLAARSSVIVPLAARGRTLGCLQMVHAESGRRFVAEDLAFAAELGRRAALALDNARLYSEVREADRRKDEFLAVLAHELRNPLAPVRNSLQILRLAGNDAEAVSESLEMMERQVGHLVRLVDDLLDVARITKGKIVLNRQPVRLDAAVCSAVESSRPLLESKGHTLSVDVSAQPIWLDADLTRLSQVVANLLNNSVRYTPPGGRIELRTESAGPGHALLRVRDNGIGIPAEKLPVIFDMFAQVDRPQERSQGGLGIGLTLVKRLVEMHGGTVEARSDGPGRGSEFVVRLPVLAAPVPESPAGTEYANGNGTVLVRPRPLGTSVVVVDDNHDAADSLAAVLRLSGYQVWVAYDGAAALELARARRPRVMFVDLGMPGMDGFEVARVARAEPCLSGVSLVALTGWGQPEDRRRTSEAGFDHHLTKPADPDVLAELLAGVGA